MALSDPIPVRFTGHADAALASISGRTGLSKAELIRISVDEFIIKTEATGEIIQRHHVAEQTSTGHGNTLNQTSNFTTSSPAPAPAKAKPYPRPKRGRKKPEK